MDSGVSVDVSVGVCVVVAVGVKVGVTDMSCSGEGVGVGVHAVNVRIIRNATIETILFFKTISHFLYYLYLLWI